MQIVQNVHNAGSFSCKAFRAKHLERANRSSFRENHYRSMYRKWFSSTYIFEVGTCFLLRQIKSSMLQRLMVHVAAPLVTMTTYSEKATQILSDILTLQRMFPIYNHNMLQQVIFRLAGLWTNRYF